MNQTIRGGVKVKKIFEFKTKATVIVDDTGVTISHEGRMNGVQDKKKIPYSSITSVHLKKPSALATGHIEFSTIEQKLQIGGVLLKEADGTNKIVLNKRDLEGAAELKNLVETKIAELFKMHSQTFIAQQESSRLTWT